MHFRGFSIERSSDIFFLTKNDSRIRFKVDVSNPIPEIKEFWASDDCTLTEIKSFLKDADDFIQTLSI